MIQLEDVTTNGVNAYRFSVDRVYSEYQGGQKAADVWDKQRT